MEFRLSTKWSTTEPMYTIVYRNQGHDHCIHHAPVLGVLETKEETLFIVRKKEGIVELAPECWQVVPRHVYYYKNGNRRSITNYRKKLKEFKADFYCRTVDDDPPITKPKKRKAPHTS